MSGRQQPRYECFECSRKITGKSSYWLLGHPHCVACFDGRRARSLKLVPKPEEVLRALAELVCYACDQGDGLLLPDGSERWPRVGLEPRRLMEPIWIVLGLWSASLVGTVLYLTRRDRRRKAPSRDASISDLDDYRARRKKGDAA